MDIDNSVLIREVLELKAKGIIKRDAEIAERMGYSKGTVSEYLNNKIAVSEQFLAKFRKQFGIRDGVARPPITKKGEAIQVNLGDFKTLSTKIVSQYAYAGYLAGYNDEHYLNTLPDYPWMVDKEYKGTYLTFQVKGDSMDDGTIDSYKEGDMLLCREIPRDLWQQSKLHIKKWDFVIVHKTEGILIKRITAHNVAKGIITIHSINDFYDDKEVKLQDVAQIFNVVQSLRKR